MAAAFTLLIAVVGSWIVLQNFSGASPDITKNNRNTIIAPPIIATPLPSLLPVEPIGNNQNDSQGNTANGSNADVEIDQPQKPSPISAQTPEQKTPPPNVAVTNPILALFAGTVRSGGSNSVLNLSRKARAATLQLNLDSVDYQNYRAELADADGNVLFQKEKLKTSKKQIAFNIPAKNLKRGDYIIKLYGNIDAEKTESVADFQFRVMR